MSNYWIRDAELDDAAAMAEATHAVAQEDRYLISGPSQTTTQLEEQLAYLLSDRSHHMLVAIDESVIGHIGLHRINNGAARLGLVVIQQWRRQGVGQALLDQAIDDALDLGLNRIDLEVFADNRAAVTFYQKNNFIITGPPRERLDGSGRPRATLLMMVEL